MVFGNGGNLVCKGAWRMRDDETAHAQRSHIRFMFHLLC